MFESFNNFDQTAEFHGKMLNVKMLRIYLHQYLSRSEAFSYFYMTKLDPANALNLANIGKILVLNVRQHHHQDYRL